MGTKIIETGSTAGGVAKVEYKDEAGNVLWYYDDAGNFVRNGNAKETGLAGTGTRIVTADSTGNLSAREQIEHGTWTPVLRGSISGVAVAGGGNKGRYTKIGKMVIFTACIHWTSISGTITGDRLITGIPYTCSLTSIRGSTSIGTSILGSVVCNSNRTLNIMVELGQSYMYVGEIDLQNGGSYTDTVTIGSTGTLFSINGCYYTD